ncbi:VOC family protein [Vibrio sp. MA40-2]|uniref:VOC family protein n=1 Tax=Vibrio sp. MA40-2 TaxID=3391828 RepID=UPI0039A4C6E8
MCNTTANKTQSGDGIGTNGIHHLGLSVPNIKDTAAFFINHLNFSQVGEKPNYPAIFVSDGSVMLTLWQIKDHSHQVNFDRQQNVGLHHFALKVANLKQLETLYNRFSLVDDIEVEFAPEALNGTPLHHMMCTIPGGIRLELICG